MTSEQWVDLILVSKYKVERTTDGDGDFCVSGEINFNLCNLVPVKVFNNPSITHETNPLVILNQKPYNGKAMLCITIDIALQGTLY